jgi:hypothetical protein
VLRSGTTHLLPGTRSSALVVLDEEMGTTDLALVGPTAGRQAGGGVVLGHVALQEVLVGIMGRLPL